MCQASKDIKKMINIKNARIDHLENTINAIIKSLKAEIQICKAQIDDEIFHEKLKELDLTLNNLEFFIDKLEDVCGITVFLVRFGGDN